MPWSETSAMDQKRIFIMDYHRGAFSLTELAARYGISRPTAYKWIARFLEEGLPGLAERSRRPNTCRRATAPDQVAAIIELRRRHPFWGAKKLLTILNQRHPEQATQVSDYC